VDILLSSRFSMWMAWGPQLTFFCNAAYRRHTLGRKYPWALGRPASEVWAEIWDDIGPRIDTVLATGKATWDEALLLFLERSGYPEESYHTFSYSPLRDDAGAVVGMLCVVSEDTERVIGERRMATLRDLGSDPSVVRTEQETLDFAGRQLHRNRRDLPFTLTYVFGDDGTAARLAASTGISASHPAAQAALAAGDPDPVWPVAALLRGESALVSLVGTRFAVLPTGAWSEPPVQALVTPLARHGGTPYGFLVAALNRYRPLPFRWPHPWVPDPGADPDGWAVTAQAFEDYKRDGGGRYTVPVRHHDGHTIWLACSSASLPSPDGRGRLFVGTTRDVTAERLAAQREATLAGFAAALAAAGEISEMLTTAAREIAAAVHASQVTTALWSSDDNPAITGWPRPAPGQGASAAVTGALDVVRHQPAASVAVLPGDEGTSLLAAPLDGTGSSAIAAEFPAGRPVSAEVRELFSVLTSHLAQVLAKARDYEQTRAVALTLQHAILAPTELPHGFAARYTPAVPPLEVGGDWYDVIPLPGQRTGVVAGDCVGRGLPAAAVMGQLRSASQAVLLRAPGPAEALTDLDTFASRIPGAECTTVFCAILDPEAGTVTYSCAGHPPPILVTAGGDYHLLDQARSLPLAMLPADWRRRQATATLPPGATLMLYTDGLVERRNQPLDKGIDAAAVAVAEHALDHPDDVADHVMSAMTPAAGYEDDVAVLIYRHPPAPLTIQVPADDPSCLAMLRTRLRQWLPAAGIGSREATDIIIAAGEAAANAFEHGTAGRPADAAPVQITLTARAAHTMVQLTVADTGSWRPPPADREQPAPGTRGHGVLFMHALMDDVTIDPSAHGTTVTLTKDLKP
jgi:serine phosphatase RsbU (regulator of sigma subunit)/anti-sigma regulatory factor (Ser/Thr protein kinase)/PAS domain-containing protein